MGLSAAPSLSLLSQPFTLHPKDLPCPESSCSLSPLFVHDNPFCEIFPPISAHPHPPPTPSPNITSSNKSAPVPRGSNLIPSALSQHDVSGLLFFFFFLGLGGQVIPSQKAQYCLSQECSFGEFPGSPVVRTLCFYCSRPRSSPWSGN